QKLCSHLFRQQHEHPIPNRIFVRLKTHTPEPRRAVAVRRSLGGHVMRKPNIIFLTIIALAALLHHASHWMNADYDTATPNSVSATVTTARPSSALVQPTEKPVARQSELIAAASSA